MSNSILLDLVFACDTTGSMGQYIAAAQRNIISIATDIRNSEHKPDVRFCLIQFRDHPPQETSFVVKTSEWTNDLNRMQQLVNEMAPSGGGDGPEAVVDALAATLELTYRPNSLRMLILIGDAPPHGFADNGDAWPAGCPCGRDPIELGKKLSEAGFAVTVYAVAAEPTVGSYLYGRDFFRFMSKATGGKYLPMTTADNLSKAVVGSAFTELSRQKLNDLILEEITKLRNSGVDLTPDQIIDKVTKTLQDKGVKVNRLDIGYVYSAKLDSGNVDALLKATSTKDVKLDPNLNRGIGLSPTPAPISWVSEDVSRDTIKDIFDKIKKNNPDVVILVPPPPPRVPGISKDGVTSSLALAMEVAGTIFDVITIFSGKTIDDSPLKKPKTTLQKEVEQLLEKYKPNIAKVEAPLLDIIARLRARQSEFEALKSNNFSQPGFDAWKNAALNPATGLASDLEILHENLNKLDLSIVVSFRKDLQAQGVPIDPRLDAVTAYASTLVSLQASGYVQLIILNSDVAEKKKWAYLLVSRIKRQARFSTTSAFGSVWQFSSRESPPFTDATGWANPAFYKTIKAVTFADSVGLIAKAASGLVTYTQQDMLSGKSGFSLLVKDSPKLDESVKTFRRFIINNKLYLAAVTATGVTTYRLDDNVWTQVGPAGFPSFDAAKDNYTMKNFVANGKGYLLARTSSGLQTWSLDVAEQKWTEVATNSPPFSDAEGWNIPSRYDTIRTFVVNNQPYLIARGAAGVATWKLDGNKWTRLSQQSPKWIDEDGWHGVDRYSTINPVVVKNTAYLVARLPTGIDTYRFNGDDWNKIGSAAPDWSNANHWQNPPYYTTISSFTIGEIAFLVGRSPGGIQTFRLNTDRETSSWDLVSNNHPVWENADGWGDELYYGTIQTTYVQVRADSTTGRIVGRLPVIFARSSFGVITYIGNPFILLENVGDLTV